MGSICVAVLASSLVLPPSAQERPDVSGIWALDPTRSESLVQGGAPPPTRLVIQQTAKELRIEATRDSTHDLTVFLFERMAPTPAEEGARVGRWSWDGLRLVTERIRDVQGQTVTAKQIYSLDAAGTQLHVETIVEVQHGYTLRGTKNYGTARDVYTRVTP